MAYNNYGNHNGSYGKPKGGYQSQNCQEEPNYTKDHPILAVWFMNGADAALVKYAEQAGKDLAECGLTNSKIRSIYSEVKRIQMGTWEKNKSAFFMLKPKVAYAYGREKKNNNRGWKIFKEIFDEAVKYVNDDKSYDNFCNFMEAILAYHKANGGKNN